MGLLNKEAKGKNGKVIGSKEYFEKINDNTLFKELEAGGKGCGYTRALRDLNDDIKRAVNEIYEDLKENGQYLRHISQEERNDTIEALTAYGEIMAMTGGSYGKIKNAVALLSLRDSDTKKRSGYSDSEIKKGVELLRSGGKSGVSSMHRLDWAQKAEKEGIARFAKRGQDRAKFMEELTGGRDERYLEDVISQYTASYKKDQIKTRSRRRLCSDEYIGYYEKQVFGEYVDTNNATYDKIMKRELEEIGKVLFGDLNSNIGGDTYIVYENRQNMLAAKEELESLRVTGLGRMEEKLLKLRRLEDFDNKVIDLLYVGEDYPVGVWLQWKNGESTLYITINVCFKGTGINEKFSDGTIKKEAIIDGFTKWSGKYNKVFNNRDGFQEIEVVCRVKETNAEKAIAVNIRPESELGISVTTGTSEPWRHELDVAEIKMFSNYTQSEKYNSLNKSYQYNKYEYTNVAKHELGHVFGLADAYRGSADNDYLIYNDIKDEFNAFDKPNTESNNTKMIMNVNDGIVTSNDIEMLILAWQRNEKQYYYKKNGHDISEAMGR